MPPSLELTILDEPLAICRLSPATALPDWATGRLIAIVRTDEELSVVCADSAVPAGVVAERGWRALKVAGPLDFDLTGVLASLAAPLAAAGVPIFALSTYDTDYVLVREGDSARALTALRAAGHTISEA